MGEREQYAQGAFSWTDLNTTETGAATDFYRALFGWATHSEPIPGGGEYTMAAIDGRRVAGLSAAPPGQHPAWVSYVTVDDADAMTARASGLGASIMAGPFDVMEAGRMGLLQDPTGAVFALWQAGESIGAELVNAPGALTLNQLNTRDPERATAFYSELFGWRIEATSGTDTPYWGIYNGDRLNAVDLRFGKILKYGKTRTQLNLDVYNLFNSNTTEVYQRNYGPTYLNPLSIMSARFFKISGQFDF